MGENGGQFFGLHMIAVDSKGNIYTGEVFAGERVQRFVPADSPRGKVLAQLENHAPVLVRRQQRRETVRGRGRSAVSSPAPPRLISMRGRTP